MLNRGNERRTIFEDEGDYAAFLRLFGQTQEAAPMRLLAYCLLPDHWHLVLWPEKDGELGLFMQRLTTTHVRRWRLHRHSVGYGHLYQGTYKSFPVQEDEHFYAVCRYVERNALRANLAERGAVAMVQSGAETRAAGCGGNGAIVGLARASAKKLG